MCNSTPSDHATADTGNETFNAHCSLPGIPHDFERVPSGLPAMNQTLFPSPAKHKKRHLSLALGAATAKEMTARRCGGCPSESDTWRLRQDLLNCREKRLREMQDSYCASTIHPPRERRPATSSGEMFSLDSAARLWELQPADDELFRNACAKSGWKPRMQVKSSTPPPCLAGTLCEEDEDKLAATSPPHAPPLLWLGESVSSVSPCSLSAEQRQFRLLHATQASVSPCSLSAEELPLRPLSTPAALSPCSLSAGINPLHATPASLSSCSLSAEELPLRPLHATPDSLSPCSLFAEIRPPHATPAPLSPCSLSTEEPPLRPLHATPASVSPCNLLAELPPNRPPQAAPAGFASATSPPLFRRPPVMEAFGATEKPARASRSICSRIWGILTSAKPRGLLRSQ